MATEQPRLSKHNSYLSQQNDYKLPHDKYTNMLTLVYFGQWYY